MTFEESHLFPFVVYLEFIN